MSLVFHAEGHRYTFAGTEVPSVTQLLPAEQFFVSPERLAETQAEGDAQHQIQNDILNGLNFDDSQFTQSFEAFLGEFRLQLGTMLLSETPLYSAKYRFAGTPDAAFAGGLIDRKRSRGSAKRRALQFAGYWILLIENGYEIKAKAWWELVHDPNTGKDVPKNVFSATAISVFLALVQNYWNQRLLNAYLKVA
jgi:hypothetical protein